MKIKYSIALILAVITASVSLTYWYVKKHMPAGKPYTAVETHSALSELIATSRPDRLSLKSSMRIICESQLLSSLPDGPNC